MEGELKGEQKRFSQTIFQRDPCDRRIGRSCLEQEVRVEGSRRHGEDRQWAEDAIEAGTSLFGRVYSGDAVMPAVLRNGANMRGRLQYLFPSSPVHPPSFPLFLPRSPLGHTPPPLQEAQCMWARGWNPSSE